jgi:hypothetical protein
MPNCAPQAIERFYYGNMAEPLELLGSLCAL